MYGIILRKRILMGKLRPNATTMEDLWLEQVHQSGMTHLKLHIAKSCPSAPREASPPREGTNIRKQVLVKQHNRTRSKGISSPSVFNEEDQKASRRNLTQMVILHEYPLAIVDHVGFWDFVSGLRPNFKIVGRNTLKRDIKKIYNEKKQKTMVEIDKNASKVAITMDLWTANNNKRSFMVTTAHYISDSWTLESRVIRYFLSLLVVFNGNPSSGLLSLNISIILCV